MLPNLHIFGIQGSGKDTQAALVAEHFDLTHLSSGALLRKRAKVGDAVARELTGFLAAGKLAPEKYLYAAIDEALDKLPEIRGVVAAGITRTLSELEGLKPHWHAHGLDSPYGILLKVSDEVALSRAKSRSREDDTEEVLLERFRLFHSETEPVIDKLQSEGRLLIVDGERPIETVFNELKQLLPSYLNSHVTD